jgi:O-methyltransferase
VYVEIQKKSYQYNRLKNYNMKKIYSLLSRLLLKKNLHLIRSLYYADKKPLFNTAHLDYIKVGTLELCAREIYSKKIGGSVAELGVYKGGFAKYINEAFPDKKLYLFDTFEGFDSKDILAEKNRGFDNSDENFSDTSIDIVLDKMKNKDQCIIKKGRFPDTTKDLVDEQFCFVSIDADLYEPIYQGLKFFYSRLTSGGYIIIDDYNNKLYPGAKEAITTFCAEQRISFTPIPDIGGGVVISKF